MINSSWYNDHVARNRYHVNPFIIGAKENIEKFGNDLASIKFSNELTRENRKMLLLPTRNEFLHQDANVLGRTSPAPPFYRMNIQVSSKTAFKIHKNPNPKLYY